MVELLPHETRLSRAADLTQVARVNLESAAERRASFGELKPLADAYLEAAREFAAAEADSVIAEAVTLANKLLENAHG